MPPLNSDGPRPPNLLRQRAQDTPHWRDLMPVAPPESAYATLTLSVRGPWEFALYARDFGLIPSASMQYQIPFN